MITLVSIGEIEESILESVSRAVTEAFEQITQVGTGRALTLASWDQRRNQHLAFSLIADLPSPSAPEDRVLGIVDADIFATGLNFVFGEADIAGRRAVISLKRLRQEFYGLPGDEKLFRERVIKEAVHEIGHTYGLQHCPNPACVMHFSNSLADTDYKGWNFCSIHKAKLKKLLSLL